MKRILSFSLILLSFSALAVAPADAKVLKKGAPSNGYYWQLIEYQSKRTQWLCRKEGEKRILQYAACTNAGAKRP